ncbi:ArsR/SmtB family transcription factor [Alkalibacillus almallahensis]|uniref:ArsR/SmtB family transcription factor n=1 Tax=Alkalibacillus almallahensis TaxID=1379154 RepID=UPI00142248D9|nr:metalloregulator ArsR/SmtB family transcription factor [Alkalibacillus almallahensis]NIK12008.1 ArsR family transcriptional regulator [Alkalibacillus almallahensis]
MMLKPQSIQQTSQTLKLLGDSNRLRMMQFIYERECCVCELVELINLSQPAISQHLRKLRDGGLVMEQRKGSWVFYRMNDEHATIELIKEILQSLPSVQGELDELEQDGLNVICHK